MTEPPASPPKPNSPAPTAAEMRGPIRNLLESIGMAVLMAVLLKYFALEAYVIPTPSMQPTLMGSPEAGETDRILVDKLYYLLHDPKRWDIVVFRYPVRQVQSYVKRIVGIGGDKLRIGGGNLYRVSDDGSRLEVLRKPERVQRTLWREIYPMRRRLVLYEKDEDPDRVPKRDDVFGEYFRSRAGKWDIDNSGAWVGTPSSSGKLQVNYRANGATNNYSDGYDLDIAAALRKSRGIDQDVAHRGITAVQDLAIGFDLTPSSSPDRVEIAIEVKSLQTEFSLEIVKGKGRLHARSPAKSEQSAEFDLPIAADQTTRLRFARLDDRLYAFRNGTQVTSFDADVVRIFDDVSPGEIVPRIVIEGKGKSKLADVRIERDLHYTHSDLPADKIIEVPKDHFFMMGDNTLGSADGRDWTAIQIGVDGEGRIVDPKTNPTARKLWGNKRPKPFESGELPHDDDNPVPLLNDRVVFVDDLGEIHPFYGKVDPGSWAKNGGMIQFNSWGEPSRPWSPEEKPAPFVPRNHIQGRPIVIFLRSLSGLKICRWIR